MALSAKTHRVRVATLVVICTTLVVVAVFMVSGGGMAPYVPVTADLKGKAPYRVDPQLNTAAHQRAVAQVLRMYGERAEFRSGRLYVSRQLARDYDLLQNYTSKAVVLEAEQSADNPNQGSSGR